MELKTKLYLVDEEGNKFMGIGVLWLLQHIRIHKSLRKGSSVLGISYSKAFGMIRNLEKSLGVAILDRKKGGANRDGATLTPFGEHFIELYETFEQEAKRTLDKPYEEFREKLSLLFEEDEDHGGL
ncbi:MAG TPA: LysR family transcriptional regulator [Spirochaetales bacterium]|jgi:molybdate transport system regulatory protein|nr:LysR family transcriptional regulator [Spirochaetales bacterium]